jgi:DNA-directed RNA polymerase subunit M/transcription elongation factor TFIIS
LKRFNHIYCVNEEGRDDGDPENRSKKDCVCGGHQGKRGKKPRKPLRQKVTFEMIKQAYLKDLEGYRDDDDNITFVGRVQCPQCLSQHATSHMKENQTGDVTHKSLYCQDCGFQWSEVAGLADHVTGIKVPAEDEDPTE